MRRGNRRSSEYPALRQWQSELAAGSRTPTRFDPLWRAACAEADAREFEQEGLREIAVKCREDALRIILTEARRERAA